MEKGRNSLDDDLRNMTTSNNRQQSDASGGINHFNLLTIKGNEDHTV